MKLSRLWLPLVTLALGVVLGGAWSSLSPSASEQARVSKKSEAGSGGSSSRQENARSGTRSQSSGGNFKYSVGDLNKEDLLQLALKMKRRDTNPLEMIRYGEVLASLNEAEALAMLEVFNAPFTEEETKAGIDGAWRMASKVLFARLCELDGQKAMDLLAQGELGQELPSSTVYGGLSAWISADSEGAQAWFGRLMRERDKVLSEGGTRDSFSDEMKILDSGLLVRSYLREMFTVDRESIETLVDSLKSESFKRQIKRTLSEQIVAQAQGVEDYKSILDNTSIEEAPELTKAVFSKLIFADLAEATEWVLAQPPTAKRDNMIAMTAAQLFPNDVIGMEKWYMAQELVTAHERSYRLHDIAVLLARKDLVESSTWLLKQPNNAERDIAEEAFAGSSAARKNWAASLGWAVDILDPERQTNAMKNTFTKAWNRETESFQPDLMEAAEEAGITDQALEFAAQMKELKAR